MYLNEGSMELDGDDPERACDSLTRALAMWSGQASLWWAGWAAVLLAEALLVVGDRKLMRQALGDAETAFERMRDRRGLARAATLEHELVAS